MTNVGAPMLIPHFNKIASLRWARCFGVKDEEQLIKPAKSSNFSLSLSLSAKILSDLTVRRRRGVYVWVNARVRACVVGWSVSAC